MTAHAEAGHGARAESKGWWRTALGTVMSKKRIAVWSLILGSVALIGLVSGAFIWWYWGSGDFTARRWKARDPVVASPDYVWAVRPHRFDEKGPVKEPPTGMTLDWTTPQVAVYSVSAPHVHPTLRDLAERGQARAIDFLEHDFGQKPHAWREVEEALNDGSGPGLGENDPFKFDRVLVATVTKGVNWDPGDRMRWTRVFVQPINFSFAGYTVAATDNVTTKVSSVEATKTRKFSADLGLTLPGAEEGPKASVGPSNERTVKTTSDITAQYEKLGIDIMPSFLRIIRESETGDDVVGNTTVSLSVVTDPLTIHKKEPNEKIMSWEDDNNLVLLVRKTKLGETPEQKNNSIDVLPQARVPHCALKAKVWMLHEERRIEAGRKYYDEARQSVRFVRDVDRERDMDIVNADDVSPAVWTLKTCSGECDHTEKDRNLQAFVVPDGQSRDLVFTDYGEAVKLAHWLRHHQGATVSNLQFNYPRPEAPHAKSLMPYKMVRDECDNKAAP
jgi:hypothetical protein